MEHRRVPVFVIMLVLLLYVLYYLDEILLKIERHKESLNCSLKIILFRL
jgi:hypothetical protein